LTLVIDTSVVVKWFVEEDGFEAARSLIRSSQKRIAPEFVVAEMANVLQRKVRIGELGDLQAVTALRGVSYFFERLIPSTELIEPSFTLSRVLDHSVYDCMFLALALDERGARLVTGDAKFLRKATAAGYGEKILNLDAAYALVTTSQENDNG